MNVSPTIVVNPERSSPLWFGHQHGEPVLVRDAAAEKSEKANIFQLPRALGHWGKGFVNGLTQDFKYLSQSFFPKQKPTSQRSQPVIDTSGAINQGNRPVAEACFDVPVVGKEERQHFSHTHHLAYGGPTITAHQTPQETYLLVGQFIPAQDSHIQEHAMLQVDPGQAVIQVTQDLVETLASPGLKSKLTDGSNNPFQLLNRVCFDTPEGQHTHHSLVTAPDVLGPSQPQPTVFVVGDARPSSGDTEGESVSKDPDQQSILVNRTLFQPDT